MMRKAFGRFMGYLPGNHRRAKGLMKRLYFGLVGTPDLHSHLRWKGVKAVLPQKASKVLDCGCGNGMYSFEVCDIYRNSAKITGIDIDSKSITKAILNQQNLQLSNCSFFPHDLEMGLPFTEETFDLVLMIDVIEHLHRDSEMIGEVARVLRNRGYIVISVPTPNYPKFFGHKFHREIGHVREGYWIEDLATMLEEEDIIIEKIVVHTFVPSALLCAFFYRYLRKLKPFLVTPLLKPLVLLFDKLWPFHREKYACSLVIRGRKRYDE